MFALPNPYDTFEGVGANQSSHITTFQTDPLRGCAFFSFFVACREWELVTEVVLGNWSLNNRPNTTPNADKP